MPVNLNFGITANALSLRAQRATLIANNIANADTPGYKAVDMDFRQILSAQAQAMGASLPSGPGAGQSLSQTHPSHFDALSGAKDFALDHQTPQYRIPSQPSLDGNTVDTQMEKAAFAENQLRYEASVQFLDDKVSGLKRAFRGN